MSDTYKATFVPVRLHEAEHNIVTVAAACIRAIGYCHREFQTHRVLGKKTALGRCLDDLVEAASRSSTVNRIQEKVSELEDQSTELESLLGGDVILPTAAPAGDLIDQTFAVSIGSTVSLDHFKTKHPDLFNGVDELKCPGCDHVGPIKLVLSLVSSLSHSLNAGWVFPVDVAGYCTNPDCTTAWMRASIMPLSLHHDPTNHYGNEWTLPTPLAEPVVVVPISLSLPFHVPFLDEAEAEAEAEAETEPASAGVSKAPSDLDRPAPVQVPVIRITSPSGADITPACLNHLADGIPAPLPLCTYTPDVGMINRFLIRNRERPTTVAREVWHDVRVWAKVKKISFWPRCKRRYRNVVSGRGCRTKKKKCKHHHHHHNHSHGNSVDSGS